MRRTCIKTHFKTLTCSSLQRFPSRALTILLHLQLRLFHGPFLPRFVLVIFVPRRCDDIVMTAGFRVRKLTGQPEREEIAHGDST